MRVSQTLLLILVIPFCLNSTPEGSGKYQVPTLTRNKRWLVWKEGINWVAVTTTLPWYQALHRVPRLNIEINTHNYTVHAVLTIFDSTSLTSYDLEYLLALILHVTFIRRKCVAFKNRIFNHFVKFVIFKLIFGIGLPFEVKEHSIVIGTVMKAYYRLPDNSSDYTRPNLDSDRKKRSSASRWTFYQIIEHLLDRYNYVDAKACLLKSICHVAAVQFEERAGLLAEIAHVVLTPSSTDEEVVDYANNEYHAAEKMGKEDGNCHLLYPECPLDPIEQFSRFFDVGKYMY